MKFTITFLCGILSLMLCGCQTTPPKLKRKVSQLGDIRMAILSKQLNIVLVNEGSRKYLQLDKEVLPENAEAIPFSAYKYKASLLTLNAHNNIRIVEDEVMQQLLNLAGQVAFYNFATAITPEQLTKKEIREKDGILVEKNNQYYLLQKEKSMFNLKLGSPDGKAYRAMKYNIYMAPHYNVMYLKQGFGKGGRN